jgi:L-asparaginase
MPARYRQNPARANLLIANYTCSFASDHDITMTAVHLIAAGGTFDKHYDPVAGQLGFAQSHLPDILQRSRLAQAPSLQVLPLLDSLDMGDSDRARVRDACQASTATQIVVVHGTDTMPHTAQVLAAAALPKCIVLTGAMVPYSVQGSDALFNLGFAMGCAKYLPHGVYIAMHGEVFTANKVRKNRGLGRFEATEG